MKHDQKELLIIKNFKGKDQLSPLSPIIITLTGRQRVTHIRVLVILALGAALAVFGPA